MRRNIPGKWFLILLGLLVGLGGTTRPGAAQAETPPLRFVETGPLILYGIPGGRLRAPIELQGGPADLAQVQLSLPALQSTARPSATILGEQIAFSPSSFALPANRRQTVYLSIAALPNVPGHYAGELRASDGTGAGAVITRPVTLEIAFASLTLTVPSNPIRLQGQADNLRTVLWLAAPDGDVTGVQPVADPLIHEQGQAFITPDAVTFKEGPLTLRQGDARPVTLVINGAGHSPGVYTGLVRFVQANQPLAEAPILTVVVELLAAPSLTLPQGESVTTRLIRPLNGVDAFLARWLLPADYGQPGVTVQLQNSGPQALLVTQVEPAITRYGPVNASGAAGVLQPISPTLSLAAGEVLDLQLAVPAAGVAPGSYKGSVTLHVADATGRVVPENKTTVRVDLSVRQGPLLALLLILTGIFFGRLVNYVNSEQARLLRRYYRSQAQLDSYDTLLGSAYTAEMQRIRAEGLALRRKIYSGELAELEPKLVAWGAWPEQLRQYEAARPGLETAALVLDAADAALLQQALDKLRQAIGRGKVADVPAAMADLQAAIPPLQRLRELEQATLEAALAEGEQQRFLAELATTRDSLLQGRVAEAETRFQQLGQALPLLVAIAAVEAEAEAYLGYDPQQLTCLLVELDLARQAVFDFDFDQARHWLRRVQAMVATWLPAKSPFESLPAREDTGDAAAVQSLGQLLTHVLAELAGWQPLAFLGAPAGAVPLDLEAVVVGLWQRVTARLAGFFTAVLPEVGLWFGRPLVWLVTVLLAVLLGFRTLYVTQALTFGADPLADYLTMFLWGLTSDVTGGTVSALADRWVGGK